MSDTPTAKNTLVDAVTLPSDLRLRIQLLAVEANCTVEEVIIRLVTLGERCSRQSHDEKLANPK